MKKFLVLLLAALMVFSFAACGGGGGSDEGAADESGMKVAMVLTMVTLLTSPSTRPLMRLARLSVKRTVLTSHIRNLHPIQQLTVFLQSKKLSRKDMA